jgi:hypothetical protein
MIRVNIFLVSLLLSYSHIYCQSYNGFDGFGNINFIDDSTFVFNYWDCSSDTGKYITKGDTIYLNSRPSILISSINTYKDGSYYTNFVTDLKIYDLRGCLIQNFTPNFYKNDTLTISGLKLRKGDLLSFSIFTMDRNFIWKSDSIFSAFLYVDQRHGKRVYFEDYTLIKSGRYLFPFDDYANELFHKINGFYFPIVKRDKNNYKTYISGFGEVK